MSAARVEISASGDAALRVTATGARETAWRLIHHLARRLDRAAVPGVVGSIPTYDALLVELDPLVVDADALVPFLRSVIAGIDADEPLTRTPRTFEVPVLYDTDGTLDLAEVAAAQGITVEEAIRLHSEPRYVVRCLGAPGGSPMLDGPAFPRPVPRLASPRPSVPIGMVSVAGRQATLTPAVAPGGWPLIGRTPLRVLDLGAEPFVPYRPGDVLVFRRIDRDEFEALDGSRMEAR